MNSNWKRREFLKKTSAATLAALAAGAPVAGLLNGCCGWKVTWRINANINFCKFEAWRH
jgi:hypothetical protein